MKKVEKGRLWFWLWLVIFLVLAGLIVYFMTGEMGNDSDNEQVFKRTASENEQLGEVEKNQLNKEGEEIITTREEKDPSSKSSEPEDPCAQTDKSVNDFFSYLDQRQYVRQLNLKMGAKAQFKKIFRRLADNPPIPAGEGADPRILTANVFHFYRQLDRETLRLISAIVKNEEGTLEINLEIFYKWITLSEQCSGYDFPRLSKGALYQYAGFLLNTVGGRAYLFRRSSGLRLLISYYSLLIVHQADKEGQNQYGLDIFPLILPLMEDINRYSDFQFQKDYILKLTNIEEYYLKKR